MGDNLLTAPLTTIKQLGEQGNQAIQSLGNNMANVASKSIDTLVQKAPTLPGMGGGGGGGSESLAPASLTKVISKVEEVLPASLKLSQKLGKTTEQAPAQPVSTTTAAPASPNGQQPKSTTISKTKSSSRITEMRGM